MTRQRAQAIVEFALILPVAAILMLMGLDFGRVMGDRLILYDAARAGAVVAAQSTTVPLADIQAAVVGSSPDLTLDPSAVQVSYPGDGTVQVSVGYRFTAITPLIAQGWGGGSLPISSSATWPLTGGNANPTPLPTPSPIPSVTPTATPTIAPPPTATATPAPTAVTTSTPTPTAVPTASPTAAATPASTATPTATARPTPTGTPSPTATAGPSATATPSASPTPAATATPTAIPTATPTATPTVTPIPTPTVTPAPTSTATAMPTPPPVPTPTVQPGCGFQANYALSTNSGWYVVFSVPVGTSSITLTYKTPSNQGGPSVYLYVGGGVFAGQPDPTSSPPPLGFIASGTTTNNAATLTSPTVPGTSVYTAYFYTSQDASKDGNADLQAVSCR